MANERLRGRVASLEREVWEMRGQLAELAKKSAPWSPEVAEMPCRRELLVRPRRHPGELKRLRAGAPGGVGRSLPREPAITSLDELFQCVQEVVAQEISSVREELLGRRLRQPNNNGCCTPQRSVANAKGRVLPPPVRAAEGLVLAAGVWRGPGALRTWRSGEGWAEGGFPPRIDLSKRREARCQTARTG